jgi:hypothetical protein
VPDGPDEACPCEGGGRAMTVKELRVSAKGRWYYMRLDWHPGVIHRD